jgi:hypothetical protein
MRFILLIQISAMLLTFYFMAQVDADIQTVKARHNVQRERMDNCGCP